MIGLFAMTACGPACWEARDDICRCSCGGANHGCHRNKGNDPRNGLKRQKVYEGFIWELSKVSAIEEMEGIASPERLGREAQAMNDAAGIRFRYAHTTRQHYGEFPVAIVRIATDGEISRWPELAHWRGKVSPIYGRPEMLWVRRDDLTRQVTQRMREAQQAA